ncbi:MAG: ribonuclease III [Acidimicrobiia bacterium]
MTLAALQARIGYEFSDLSLLERALTHRSYCAEHAGEEPNERLELLGDAVLGLVVTEQLYVDFPEHAEGELAKARAAIVSSDALFAYATEVDLGGHLRLGKGEEASGGREKASILADACEAVMGAVFLDGGFEAAKPFVLRLVGDRLHESAAVPGTADFKTRLQELAAQQFEQLPRYQVRFEGPDHERTFFAAVRIDGTVFGEGEGRSKKAAEQHAAERAWLALQQAVSSTARGNDAGAA